MPIKSLRGLKHSLTFALSLMNGVLESKVVALAN